MKKTKAIILGIDGADPIIINNLIKKNLLPNFSKIKKDGILTELLSTLPPTTYPAWTSFFTGAEPSFHGVTDFTVKQGYKIKFTNTQRRELLTIFEHLENNNLTTSAAWFPAMYPPLKTNGYQISGWDSPVTSNGDSSFVYPHELHKTLSNLFSDIHLKFDPIDEFSNSEKWYEEASKSLISRINRRGEMALWLLKNRPVDVASFYFGETDTAAHHFYAFYDDNSPRRPDNVSKILKETIENVYIEMDKVIGNIISASDNAPIFILSDHGSMGNSDHAVFLNRFLHKAGLLNFKKQNFSFEYLPSRNNAAKLIPKKIRRKIFNAFGGLFPTLYESVKRFSSIDFKTTQAFSEEIPYAPSIWINQLGREPKGLVPFSKRDEIYKKLLIASTSFKFSDNTSIIKKIHRREDIHKGPYAHLFPDFILELNLKDGFLPVCQNSNTKTAPLFERLDSNFLLGRKGTSMPGGHSSKGIFASTIKNIADKNELLKIHQTANIICKALNIPLLNKNLNTIINKKNSQSLSKKEQRAVADRLKRLGYLDL
ncbi:MAG: alkaline phosphatase family protein [Deltaproteobacteria bacterium]|nr:alkaline phosphatase family protein [Deltaproteobacteria bacterium]